MTKKPNDKERIKHMLEAIEKIFRYTKDLTIDKFKQDDLVQDAVIKNFEILGEAAYHISKELKEKHPHIEWKKIEGLRHILVHDYYKINPEILWNTKDNNLADLKDDLETLFSNV